MNIKILQYQLIKTKNNKKQTLIELHIRMYKL
jgi:hypothetical protein